MDGDIFGCHTERDKAPVKSHGRSGTKKSVGREERDDEVESECEKQDGGIGSIREEQLRVRKLVGRNVARLRADQKLTKRHLSRIAGIGRHTLDKVENGRNVAVNTLARIASALGVSLANLLDEDADAE